MKKSLEKFNIIKNRKIKVDDFINRALYKPKIGYYTNKMPFGKKGDFVTSPTISNLFSEIIAIWIISSWETLGKPKIFNLVELGPGDGSLSEVLLKTFKNFPTFNNSVKFFLYEKSEFLRRIQKKKLKGTNLKWINDYKNIKGGPIIFFGNEFFDAIPIKQFFKKENRWFEKFVCINQQNKGIYTSKKFNMNKLEKKINFKISKNQNFIEYSEEGLNYLKNICEMIKKNSGGLLLIDYGYTEKKMKNTLQAISNHKFANILSNIGNIDITHNISFRILKSFLDKIGGLNINLTTQKDFLINMGIKKRAEIISKKASFLKKADIYYRLKRLIDDNEMGNLFKVMLIRNKKNKFKIGF